jgi:branched-chain amino acid transport system permease protein
VEIFVQQILNGLVIGSTYAVVAIGFSLVFIVLRVVNFAHPDIFMLGMFGGLAGITHLGGSIPVALLSGAIAACLAGLVLERAVIRPLHGRDVLTTLLATLGVSIIIQNATALIVGPDPISYVGGLNQRWTAQAFGYLSHGQLFNLAVSLSLVAVASFYVRRTRYGRATRAIAERPDVAAAFGVNVVRVSQVTVALASAMAGVGAVSVSLLYGNAWAFIGAVFGLKAFVAMLVAGNRHFEGVVVVALGLGVLEALVAGYVSSGMRDAVAFLVLIGVLYLRPSGLFGSYAT